MAKDIKIPQIAEGVETATVNEILVTEGDTIEKDQSLITVESDKASVDIPSPQAGTVKSIKVSEGDEVNVGDVIISLEEANGKEEEETEDTSEENKKEEKNEAEATDSKEEDSEEKEKKKSTEKDEEDEEDKASSKDDEEQEDEAEEEEGDEDDEDVDEDEEKKKDKKKAKKEQKQPENDDAEEEEPEESKEEAEDEEIDAPASPGVRRFARELGVNLSKVKGSGAKGRISKEDVKKHNKQEQAGGSAPKSSALPDFNKWGETERKALSGIRSATAKNVANAWSAIPHVFQFDESDITEIEAYMEKNKEKAEKAGGHLTITAILVKIAATALRQFPKFNGSIDMENKEMILKKYVHIGVAVDTEKGLLVPVIRNADQKTIIDISKEINDLAEKARAGKLSGDEMKGGSFTISNLGGLGGTNFTPIVNHPQVAILGVSRAKKQPVYIDENLEPRDILPLSLSYDHRMIDGAEGVRFLNWISRALEDPYKALLGV